MKEPSDSARSKQVEIKAQNVPHKNMSELLDLSREKNLTLPLKVRHLIYSYLDISTILQKISLLSTYERLSIVDSSIVSKNKNYKIQISGQRNAQR